MNRRARAVLALSGVLWVAFLFSLFNALHVGTPSFKLFVNAGLAGWYIDPVDRDWLDTAPVDPALRNAAPVFFLQANAAAIALWVPATLCLLVGFWLDRQPRVTSLTKRLGPRRLTWRWLAAALLVGGALLAAAVHLVAVEFRLNTFDGFELVDGELTLQCALDRRLLADDARAIRAAGRRVEQHVPRTIRWEPAVPRFFYFDGLRTRDWMYLTIPAWLPVLPLLLIGVAILWLTRPVPGHCARCSYNLTGNTTGTCPECGQGVPQIR